MSITTQTVESFSLCLDGYQELLQADNLVQHVETRLLQQLESPIRLLRWAIVRVEATELGSKFWCEGAYLKTCQ